MPRHHSSLLLSPTSPQLSYQDGLLAIGSCFAQNLGQQLQQRLYAIQINPFGVVYNPASICQHLQQLLGDHLVKEQDLLPHRDAWHSLQHHSSFSGTSRTATLQHMNKALQQARQHLQQTRCLLLTFGTAWVYTWKSSGQVVSNCHRFASSQFERRRLSVQEIVALLSNVLPRLQAICPHLKVLLTISPVRHLKDGFVENQVSKATLVLAVQELIEQWDSCYYFPAYELLLDDLRDYRYYDRDLVHPNELAVDYVWQAFEQAHLLASEQPLRQQVAQLQQAAQHRARQRDSSAHQAFLQKQLAILEKICYQLPVSGYQKLREEFLTQIL